MDKPFNLIVIDTKEEIIKLLNEAKLPIIVSQMIINDVKNIIDANAQKIIMDEKIKYKEESNSDK